MIANVHVHAANIDGWITLAAYILAALLIALIWGAKKEVKP